MHRPVEPQQWQPQIPRQWGPHPQAEPSKSKKKINPALAITLAAVTAFSVLIGIGLVFSPDKTTTLTLGPGIETTEAKPARTTKARVRVPRPTGRQRETYLVTLHAIHPALAADEDLAISRGRAICARYLNPPGGAYTLTQYAVIKLSAGTIRITKAQAHRVLTAIHAWCRRKP